jgi:hypothetical protein
MNSIEFFEKNKWLKINNFIDENIANIFYYHVLLEEQRLKYLIDTLGPDIVREKYTEHYGTVWDTQVPNNFSKYGEPIFDTLLGISIKNIEKLIGKKLIPTYSYHRLYINGAELKKHKDRPSCEISGTLCLGYDITNLENKNWNWPMWVKDKDGSEHEIFMKPGDMILYRGCEVEHWREKFTGINHAQVFLHYNDTDGQYNIKYDGRPLLGFPGSFKNKTKEEQERLFEKKNNQQESKNISNKDITYNCIVD